MKKLIYLLLVLLPFQLVFAQTIWFDPQKAEFNPVDGQYWQNEQREGFYNRVPLRFKAALRPAVWDLALDCAGESILFRTNSKNIEIQYEISRKDFKTPHIPQTSTLGADLYGMDNEGESLWFAPSYKISDEQCSYSYQQINYRSSSESSGYEYRLFLPLRTSLEWLKIGVDSTANFEFIKPRSEKPIVVYGTSITHGAAASRPGMAWTSIVSRELDMPLLNFGFAGNGKLEDGVIDMICEIDAAVFVLDCMPNLASVYSGELTKLIVKQVKKIRSAHPATPIVLTDHLGYPHSKVYKRQENLEVSVLHAQLEAYNQLKLEGVEHIYHLTYKDINMPNDATVEGIHPSDYGMRYYADAYNKLLRKVLHLTAWGDSSTNSSRQRRDYKAYEWTDRHEKILAINRDTIKYRRAFIGNSIVHQWGGVDDFRIQRAPELWDKHFSDCLNLGFGWDRIENVIWRIEHGELDGQNFEEIIIKIGTNNISLKHTDEQITEGIKQLLSSINFRQPKSKITLLGVLPRRGLEGRVKTLNLKIASLAKSLNYVSYKDVGRGLLQSDGKINEKLFVDGLHPNAEGYEAVALSMAL
ncbi:MAG: SGNH/GDSL hydrolase family protein [Rikenellaceae bacterium]